MVDEKVLSAKRLIYVALTRAKERLVLEWHSHLIGSKRTTYHSVLMDETGGSLVEAGLTVAGNKYPCLMSGNDGTPPTFSTGAGEAEYLPTYGRRALVASDMQEPQAEIFSTPSSLAPEKGAGHPPVEEVTYGSPMVLDVDLAGAGYGTMIHRCFEVLTMSTEAKLLLTDATGHPITDGQASVIAAAHSALMEWLKGNLSAGQISAEMPFSGLASDGSVCTGIFDLLVETPDGYWVIDHKTDRATEEGEIFGQYWPQLQAYRDAIQGLGHVVAGVGLNLVNDGKLLLSRVLQEPRRPHNSA